MKRVLLAILTLFVLAGQPASAQDAVVGQWYGVGLQTEPADAWTIALTLNADGSGRIDYPSLECGGELRREAVRDGVVFFRERITYGVHCVSNGTIGVFPQAGRLMWFWTGEQTDYPDMSASAVLTPTEPTS